MENAIVKAQKVPKRWWLKSCWSAVRVRSSKANCPGIQFDKVTFDELSDGFLRDYRINQKKSLVRAEWSVNHLKAFFEKL